MTGTRQATCHRDLTVSYWSVYQGRWVSHATFVPDEELAAMGDRERERVLRHLERLRRAEELGLVDWQAIGEARRRT